MLEMAAGIPLFAGIAPAVLQKQIDGKELYIKRYAKGATVWERGENCETLDIVLSGRFVTYALAENGSERTLFTFAEGQALGANLLFGDNHRYPLAVYCLSEGRLLHVSKKAVADFLHHYDFVMKFAHMLSQNAQKLNRRMTMSMQRTLRENLLEYFEQQAVLQQSGTIVLPISKKQLADYLGVQRPSLFRELKNLKEKGAITVAGREITLHFLR